MMTMNQAAARQVKWKQRLYRTPCDHVILELESNEQGYLTSNFVCNLCGESVPQGALATSIRTSMLLKALATVIYPPASDPQRVDQRGLTYDDQSKRFSYERSGGAIRPGNM